MKTIHFVVLFFISSLSYGQSYAEQHKKCSEILKDAAIGSDGFWEKLKTRDNCLVGLQTPSFEVTTLKNEKLSNTNLRGKVVVLNFWFTRCAPCIEEMPFLNKVAAKHKNDEVVFLSIANEDAAQLKKFLETTKFDFKVVPDGGRILMDTFKLFSAWPTTIIIDRQGKIRFINQGGLTKSNSNFEKVLKQALMR